MDTITITPQESPDVLVNPGMGWTTFFSFNGDEINENYPRCSMAYFRFYWDELEPREGEYSWEVIDELIRIGKTKGQTLALRIMVMDGDEWASKWRQSQSEGGEVCPKNHRVPEWFRALGSRGSDFIDHDDWPPGTPPMWEPDYGDPVFIEKHGNFIAALGQRYDGHPGIDHVDIGTVGRWGEWHCGAVPPPSLEAKQAIIDRYLSAFRKTPLLMLVGDQEGLAHAIGQGTGWRADCLGDCRQDFFNPLWEGGTPHWNHTEDVYLQRLVGAKALKAWKKAPVAFESCWSLEHWQEQGWPVHCTFDYALALHCSIFNNKSRPVPVECQSLVQDFLKRLGYRFVLRSLSYPKSVGTGEVLPVAMTWENRGVAVCHGDYQLVFRLGGAAGAPVIIPAESSLVRRLPGRHQWEEFLRLPAGSPRGRGQISLAMVRRDTGEPAVDLAIEGKGGDGWYSLGPIEIV